MADVTDLATRQALTAEEIVRREQDAERWGPDVCYCEDHDGPHIHCAWGGWHIHGLTRPDGIMAG